MPLTYGPFFIKYGQAAAIDFCAESVADSRIFISGVTGPVTADVALSKDGTAFGAHSITVTQVGGALYRLNLLAADAQFTRALVAVEDAAGAAYKDVVIHLYTTFSPSVMDIDATAGPTNATALKLTPNGTGQHTNLFSTVLGWTTSAGPSTIAANTVARFIQMVWARFYHKRTQDATQQKVFEADGTTALGTLSTSKASGVQTIDKAT